MPEQDELHCARCGEPNVWDGETRENVCPSCRAGDAEAHLEWLQERDWLDSVENGGVA